MTATLEHVYTGKPRRYEQRVLVEVDVLRLWQDHGYGHRRRHRTIPVEASCLTHRGRRIRFMRFTFGATPTVAYRDYAGNTMATFTGVAWIDD
jgi:hypothetical protein